MMDFALPSNPAELMPLVAPLVTFLIGLGYFLFPGLIFEHLGLEGVEKHPEAVGEGRSSFAGFAIGLSAVTILFQQPILFQALALAWAVVVLGKILHLVTGGWRTKPVSVILRLIVAIGIAALAWQHAYPQGVPDFQDGLWQVPSIPQQLPVLLMFLAAGLTLFFAVLAFFLPRAGLSVMRLQQVPTRPGANGEIRGFLAGMYFGPSILLFMNPDVLAGPAQFLAIAFVAGWGITALGRMIAMLSDRGNNLFNWLSLLMEIGLAAIPIAAIIRLI